MEPYKVIDLSPASDAQYWTDVLNRQASEQYHPVQFIEITVGGGTSTRAVFELRRN